MRLAAENLVEQARWLTRMRWVACAAVTATVWMTSATPAPLVSNPAPLYWIAAGMVAYNLAFAAVGRWSAVAGSRNRPIRALILLQVVFDLVALTLLIYFADVYRNPFAFYFVFHVILASILLPGRTPYVLALVASVLFGGAVLLQTAGVVPAHPLSLPWTVVPAALKQTSEGRLYVFGVLTAFATTLFIAVFLTTSVSRYVERVQAEMRQHAKMLGIGQLVAGFAHQVSNPLDGLQNGLRQLEQRVRGDLHLLETTTLMAKALGRIEHVARRLQEFARPHGLELQACDVNRSIEATLQLFDRSLADRGVAVEKDLGQVRPAWGDPYSVEEVLFNLCTNALDAMPAGGTLSLRTRELERPDLGAQGCVQIEVADTGPGIPADRLEKIFEPFFTTKSQSGGTGLGLGLCRMLVAEMGGSLEVESLPNHGATFRVVMALAAERKVVRHHEGPGR